MTETDRSGDQTWRSLVKLDNKTAEKRCLERVWNRFMSRLVMKSFSINNPFNSKLYREVLHRRKPGGAA